MKSTISSKGQITVPVEVRSALGLRPGTEVLFELQPAGVLVRKGRLGSHPVDEVFGKVELGGSVDAVVDEMRGPRPQASRKKRAPRSRRR